MTRLSMLVSSADRLESSHELSATIRKCNREEIDNRKKYLLCFWKYTYFNRYLDFTVYNIIFNIISALSRRPVYLSMLYRGSFLPILRTIFSKQTDTFPHDHSLENGRRKNFWPSQGSSQLPESY